MGANTTPSYLLLLYLKLLCLPLIFDIFIL